VASKTASDTERTTMRHAVRKTGSRRYPPFQFANGDAEPRMRHVHDEEHRPRGHGLMEPRLHHVVKEGLGWLVIHRSLRRLAGH
jgi:hypothetical protein